VSDRPVLALEGVVRRFGGLTAVDGVSLTLGPGRRLAVIGPNGAGKTTLFRLIAGDMGVSAGRVELLGRDVTRMPAHRRARLGLARTFQVSNLFSGLSVIDNVRLAAQAREPGRWRFWAPIRAGDRVGAAAMAALERVGLGVRAGDRVADLSHGEQRQLEVALALATEPKLLLLDEPAAGLPAGERARLRDLLGSLPPSLPLVLIEHDMTLALSLADEVLCLHNGRVIAHGSPAEVRADDTVQAVYLGRAVDA
jgi:branched-chain amino acid transport system ATP-binding protein